MVKARPGIADRLGNCRPGFLLSLQGRSKKLSGEMLPRSAGRAWERRFHSMKFRTERFPACT
jgi:hypothetical protein